MVDHKNQSLEIINEMIQLVCHKFLLSIITDLFSQTWFSLLSVDTRDITNCERVLLLCYGYQKSMILIKISLACSS